MMDLLKQIGAGGANLAHTFLSCDRTGIAHNDQMWSGITVASMMCGNDASSFLEWSMVVERVVRFGEGTVVIGTCKKPAWTLMMSCGTWNERESKCVLSMRVVSFFEWGRVLYYTGQRYLPCRYWWLWCLDSVGGQDRRRAKKQLDSSECVLNS